MQITSILVPTDFSEDSYYALNHAIEIAQLRPGGFGRCQD